MELWLLHAILSIIIAIMMYKQGKKKMAIVWIANAILGFGLFLRG